MKKIILIISILSILIVPNLIFATSPTQTTIFSKSEQLWIKKHPTIIVGGEMDWAPFDFVENGIYQGISNDYLKIIEQVTGINIQIQTGQTWEELLKALKDKKIDMLPSIYHSDEREEFVNFTVPYFKVAEFIFAKKDKIRFKTIESLYGKTVAIIKG